MLALVRKAQVDRRKLERGRAALLVEPLDLRIADLDRFLAQQPIAEAGIALPNRKLDARHVKRAALVAAHGELRTFDAQCVQSQLPMRERAP